MEKLRAKATSGLLKVPCLLNGRDLNLPLPPLLPVSIWTLLPAALDLASHGVLSILLATLDHFTLPRHSILEVTCDFFISFGNTLTPSPFLWKISGVTTFLSCHFVAWHWALPIPCRTQLLLIAPHGLDPLTFPAHLLPFLPGPSMHLTLSSLCAFAHALPRDW